MVSVVTFLVSLEVFFIRELINCAFSFEEQSRERVSSAPGAPVAPFIRAAPGGPKEQLE
jgi:hypothetical protein